MVQLISHSNPLIQENRALKQKNIVSSSLACFLVIVSALSIGSCRRNAVNLEKANQENKALKGEVEHFRQDAANVALENFKLKGYVADAQDFVNSIHPPYPDLIDGKSASAEGALKAKHKKEIKEYEDACKGIGN